MKTRGLNTKKTQSQTTNRGDRYRNNTSDTEGCGNKNKTKKKYFQLLRQRETPGQRASRLQRNKDDKQKRRAAESEEERLERKRREAEYVKNRRHNETPEQRMRRLLQRKKHYREKREKEEKTNSKKRVKGSLSMENTQSSSQTKSIIEKRNNEIIHERTGMSTEAHRQSNLFTELPLPEETKFNKQSSLNDDSQIKKRTRLDVLSNLIHTLCKRHHSQCEYLYQYQRQYFDNHCIPSTTNHILVTILWRKYKNYINDENRKNLNNKTLLTC